MGASAPVILSVTTSEYGRVAIEASDGMRYVADLASLSSVYCYPATKADWDSVAIDSYGLALVWASRFEVHVDQIVALATRSEPIERTA
jgi:hypothetical protein